MWSGVPVCCVSFRMFEPLIKYDIINCIFAGSAVLLSGAEFVPFWFDYRKDLIDIVAST